MLPVPYLYFRQNGHWQMQTRSYYSNTSLFITKKLLGSQFLWKILAYFPIHICYHVFPVFPHASHTGLLALTQMFSAPIAKVSLHIFSLPGLCPTCLQINQFCSLIRPIQMVLLQGAFSDNICLFMFSMFLSHRYIYICDFVIKVYLSIIL